MSIAAWQVVTWPAVTTTPQELTRSLSKMRHLVTIVQESDDGPTGRRGQALWSVNLGGREIGIAWDWAEAHSAVVALADPMNVLSNAVLVDAAGACLDEAQRIVWLNSLIHGLRWQAQVPGRPEAQLEALAA